MTGVQTCALPISEAIVPYPGTKDVQVMFDQGDTLVNGVICKDVTAAERRFVDAIIRVD